MKDRNANTRVRLSRLKALVVCAAVGLGLSLAPGVTFAQSPDGTNAIQQMSGQEKIEAASKARRQLVESAQQIKKIHDDAVEADEDASRIRCLDDALASVTGFVNVAQNSYEGLQVAVSAQDSRSANHNFLMVTTSAKRASSIEAKAHECIGSALRYAGDSQTVQDIDPRLGAYDPTAYDAGSGGAFVFLEELPPKATAER